MLLLSRATFSCPAYLAQVSDHAALSLLVAVTRIAPAVGYKQHPRPGFLKAVPLAQLLLHPGKPRMASPVLLLCLLLSCRRLLSVPSAPNVLQIRAAHTNPIDQLALMNIIGTRSASQ